MASRFLNMERPSLAGIFKKNRVLWHVIFWIWLYILDVLIFGIAYDRVANFTVFALLEMPGQLLFAYGVVYWVFPRYLSKGNYAATLFFSFVAFIVIGIIVHILFVVTAAAGPESFFDIPKMAMRAFYCFLKALIFIVIKLIGMWYENQRQVTELEKNRLESELKMLRDQVNPHFMFNTLNNLYGLIGKNPQHAQQSVLGFSGILRYMLYDSNHQKVPLNSELKCIEDYLELEKLRYPGNLSVSMNVQAEVKNLSIVPLCIFPFVENSFKHGASEHIRDAWINIDFSVYKGDFIFKIENSKGRALDGSGMHGIGLKNVKRRLELIYNNDHRLQIVDGDETFLVILKIALKEMKSKNTEVYEGEMSYR